MQTKYLKSMSAECPHDCYPRPQFKRDSYICLNGRWDFGIGDGEDYPFGITVPFCPESLASGLKMQVLGKTLRYRRTFSLPDGFNRGRVILNFGAVDQICRVYINGTRVGAHEGGYLPFAFDITDAIIDGENEVTVMAYDDLDHKYPWGKQKENRGGMWYTPVSGIWQTVWLESLPENAITGIKITPTEDGATVKVYGGDGRKTLTLMDGEGEFSFDGDEVTVKPRTVRKWSPEEPHLYRFTLKSENDEIESYFAIRTVDVRCVDGVNRICLNGEPYVFNGLLDQGYYSDGIYLPATVDGYIDDIKLVKSLGFNTLRKHIKIEPMIFYYLCDSMGVCVFQDMVNNGGYSFFHDTALPTMGLQRLKDEKFNADAKTRKIFADEMAGTANLLYNSPCVVYYTIFNEGWGQFTADAMYERMKAIDGTRIIDSTSGWFRRTKSDVDSRHIYFKPLKPKKLDGRPLVISEFGGYAHRVDGHCYTDKVYGYRLFEDREKFEDAVVRLYTDEVAPLVRAGASAFIYTQVSDVEDETNGFVTYDREIVKVDVEKIRGVMKSLQ